MRAQTCKFGELMLGVDKLLSKAQTTKSLIRVEQLYIETSKGQVDTKHKIIHDKLKKSLNVH